jgi:hypothetical protein
MMSLTAAASCTPATAAKRTTDTNWTMWAFSPLPTIWRGACSDLADMDVDVMHARWPVDRDHDLLDALRPGDPTVAGAVVTVRLLPDAWMWTWEIWGPGGEVTDSGWTSEWAAYGTAEEANAAGRQRLTRQSAAAGR